MKHVITALKAFIVGGTMLVPGVSGGSMAMILGVYDDLISSVSSFFKNKKRNALFLGLFVVFALLGIVLCASPLESLTDKFPKMILFFFIGAIAGGAPMMVRKAKIQKLDWRVLVYPLIGCLGVFLISLIPEGLFNTTGTGFFHSLMLLVAGLIVAIALILPGISTSHMLLTLGLYESILKTIKSHDIGAILSLWPLILGLLIGIAACTRLLENLLNDHPTITYLIVFGFLIGSVVDVFPGLPIGWEIPICLVLFAAGFAAIFFMTKLEEKKELADATSPKDAA
ncbi:DUF368 domain-containing protein [Scatolibacter rhodanostii]|uniref:DUF368 domain-containing protein n=1 Tax=Scatolibacter rhodanostii TaxID=2014781 RepID=UPI001FA88E47|nr:DUF368 domain-containing protein [Scatolibacter rhodanostii]